MRVTPGEIAERDGRLTLDFEDPEGQRLTLVDDGGAGVAFPWERSPVPATNQIRGLGPILLSVPRLQPTAQLLTQALNMRLEREYAHPRQRAANGLRLCDGRWWGRGRGPRRRAA